MIVTEGVTVTVRRLSPSKVTKVWSLIVWSGRGFERKVGIRVKLEGLLTEATRIWDVLVVETAATKIDYSARRSVGESMLVEFGMV